MPTDFTLPELGENVTSGDVLQVLVHAGDVLAKDQTVLELETDKATIEVPSSVAGKITEIKVKAGDKVKVGQAILSVEEADGAAQPAAPSKGAAPAASEAAPEPEPAPQAAEDEGEQIPQEGSIDQHVEGARREPARDKAGVKDQKGSDRGPQGADGTRPTKTPVSRREKVVDISRGTRAPAESPAEPDAPPAPAAPSVRRMARELGVDINVIPGTGADGRISIEDVKAYVSRLTSGAGGAGAAPAEPLPDFSRWGDVERQPMRGVRRKTAQHLAAAWAAVPHVTQHDAADITALEEVRRRYASQVESAGGSLTLTAILLKTAAAALKRFPQFNASIDMAAEEIVYKKYVNIGIAVDTGRGLLVPVIRDADAKNVTEISIALAALSEKARAGKLSLDEMQGGGFSISNLGGIGGTAFTPIVNLPEVAILGVSRARMEPVWQAGAGDADGAPGRFSPRLMLPLSLSYDHRAIDGADAARFLRWIIEALEQPFLLALQG